MNAAHSTLRASAYLGIPSLYIKALSYKKGMNAAHTMLRASAHPGILSLCLNALSYKKE